MLWKIRVLDQVLFAKCINRKTLQNFLENKMDIATAVVKVQALFSGDVSAETLAPEILINLNQPALNQASLYSTGISTQM